MPMIDERHHHRHEVTRRVGKNRQREADEPVRAHLQEHGRQDDRAGRRRVGVRIGQPRVEREHRHLDGEPEEEREEHPPLQVERHVQLLELRDVERVHARDAVVVEVERQNAEQHDDAADEGVQEELDRRVQPAVAAPDADEEVHRHEHHFPEQEEQQEVEADERAHHAGLQDEQEDVVLLQALGNRRPRRQDGDGAEERRQQHEQRAEAVDAEEVLRADRRNPRHAARRTGSSGPAGCTRTTAAPRPGIRRAPKTIRDPPNRVAVLFRHEQQQRRADERQEQNQRQKRKVGDIRHGTTSRANKCSQTRTRLPASAARSSEPARSGHAGTRSSTPRTSGPRD